MACCNCHRLYHRFRHHHNIVRVVDDVSRNFALLCCAANAAVLFFTRELAHREEKEALAQAFVDELCEHKEW